MATTQAQDDRRAEARREIGTPRITWTRPKTAGIHTGWVSDVAKTSVTFVTPTRDRPTPGEAINLAPATAAPIPLHKSVQVVRVSPFDRYFSVVGCRVRV